jgi:hypothetical protein
MLKKAKSAAWVMFHTAAVRVSFVATTSPIKSPVAASVHGPEFPGAVATQSGHWKAKLAKGSISQHDGLAKTMTDDGFE